MDETIVLTYKVVLLSLFDRGELLGLIILIYVTLYLHSYPAM